MISDVIIIDKYPLKAQHRHGLWIKLTSLRILSLLKTPFAKLDFEILNFDHLALLEITHFEKYVRDSQFIYFFPFGFLYSLVRAS